MNAPPRPPGPPEPPPPPPEPSAAPRTGRLVGGLVIVLVGVGWLLDVLNVTDFPWDVVLPAALILVGGALLFTSRFPSGHAGLMATGVVLTVVLFLGSALDVPLSGGVGDRNERPTTIAALRDEYRLGVGDLTLDLRDLPVSGIADAPVETSARVGIGRLTVILPDDMSVRVEARASIGSVTVFGDDDGGIDVERVFSTVPGGDAAFELVVTVGLGEVEVRGG